MLLVSTRSEDLVQIFYCTVAWFRFGLTTTGTYQRRSLWAVIIKIIILKRDELNAGLIWKQCKRNDAIRIQK